MQLYFFRGPNFGDELNEYLLPKIFPDFFDDDASIRFLGIGSILYDTHPREATKVVFGSGYGKYSPPPVIDESWKIYCVRGPKTAAALGLDRKLVAADSAVLINRYRSRDRVIRHKLSFMPHFESLMIGQWEEIAQELGLNLIDPRWPVEQVLAEIEASEVILAEAMHGAITSDALRVPWIPLAPVRPTHRFKWYDWADALNIKLRPQFLAPSSLHEALVARMRRSWVNRVLGGMRLVGAEQVANAPFKLAAANSLRNAMRAEPSLSADADLDRALEKLETAALAIRRDFPQLLPAA